MTAVTGPISTLPGAVHPVKIGTMCDYHITRPAVIRVQGETDSFGSEMINCCEKCYDRWKNAPPRTGTCDSCKSPNQILRSRRNYEEGMSGPVYQLCDHCIKKDNDRVAKKLEEDEEIEVLDALDYDGEYTDEFSRY